VVGNQLAAAFGQNIMLSLAIRPTALTLSLALVFFPVVSPAPAYSLECSFFSEKSEHSRAPRPLPLSG